MRLTNFPAAEGWDDEITDLEVANAIRSVPAHFAPDGAVATPPSAGSSGSTPPAAAPAPSAPATPQAPATSPPAGSGAPAAGSAPGGGTPGAPSPPAQPGQPGAASPGATTAPTVPPWLASLRAAGVNLPDLDEPSAVRMLAETIKRSQQLQRMEPHVKTFLEKQAEFEAWQRSQAPQPGAAQQQQQPWFQQWWNPPEFDQNWTRWLETGADGQVVERQGAPPGIAAKYANYMGWRQQQAEKFFQNPLEFMREPMQHVAAAVAQQMIQQNLGGYQEQLAARQIAEQNAGWIFQRDQQGAFVNDPITGQRALSPWGEKYAGYVRTLSQQGVRDVNQQHELAVGLVQRDYYASQQNGPAAAQADAAAKAAFLAQGNPPNHGGSTPPAGGAPPPPPGQSLADRLRNRLKGVAIDNAP